VDADTHAGSDPTSVALDLALESGRAAVGSLQRLKNEIADAQAGAASDWFWPFALFKMFPRQKRRRLIRQMTAEVQVDLAALDAAVETLRAVGMPLPVREDFQASRARRRDVQADAPSGGRDSWAGPMHLVDVTLQRVGKMLDELGKRRGA